MIATNSFFFAKSYNPATDQIKVGVKFSYFASPDELAAATICTNGM